ncbi:sensor histidine kinase [Arthrobacter sulfonylureivorans]|uniref:sensor histidine kinase n=1 Tax=Arthrobacter sulfonylureivorans TaxID=2486855 RepID=UPI0039E36209
MRNVKVPPFPATAPQLPSTEPPQTGWSWAGADTGGSAAEPGGAQRRGRGPHRPGLLKSWPLRRKLLLATLTLLAIMSATVGVVGYGVMSVYLTSQLDQQLEEASNRAIRFGMIFRGAPEADSRDMMNIPAQGAGTLNARIRDGEVRRAALLTADGRRQNLPARDIAILTTLAVNEPATNRTLSVGEYRLVADRDPEDGSTIITGLPLAGKENILASLTATTLIVSGAGLIATGLLGMVIIRRTLRPLEDLSAVATQVSELPLDKGEVALAVRVPPDAALPVTEVGRVGQAFNLMLDNVGSALAARQQSETNVRQFVADASHELRTPLASIRGYSELLRLTETLSPDGRLALERVESESRRMTSLVEDLLLLARLDEGHPPRESEVDLTQLVIESVSDAQVTAPAHSWRLELPDMPVTVRGDEGQLRQTLINLLTNAHRHTDPGTAVVTSLSQDPGGGAVVTVADNGPGIAPDFVDRIFARFTRADASRSGGTHGLGLSIAAAIVAAHGGHIGVRSSPGDTEFTIRLPGPEPGPRSTILPDTP